MMWIFNVNGCVFHPFMSLDLSSLSRNENPFKLYYEKIKVSEFKSKRHHKRQRHKFDIETLKCRANHCEYCNNI